jgi:hypothetical protein
MNASDIIKAKQNRTLYKAYYNPTVYNSTITSTIYPYSSINGGTPSYTSTINTQYTYTCNPTYIDYELAYDIAAGKYECGGKSISELAWKNTDPTLIFNYYSTSYSSISTTSTTILTAPGPVICPQVEFYQGTNFANDCNVNTSNDCK